MKILLLKTKRSLFMAFVLAIAFLGTTTALQAQVINESFEETTWASASGSGTINLSATSALTLSVYTTYASGTISSAITNNSGSWLYSGASYATSGTGLKGCHSASSSIKLNSSKSYIITPVISGGVSQVTLWIAGGGGGISAGLLTGTNTTTALPTLTSSSIPNLALTQSFVATVSTGTGTGTATYMHQVTYTYSNSGPCQFVVANPNGGSSGYIDDIVITSPVLGPQAPKVSALSVAGTAGTHKVGTLNIDTFKVNLPYTSYTVGVTSVPTTDITATVDSTGFTTQIQKSGVDITSFIVGDTIKYSVSKNTLTNTYVIITSANVPAPTMTNPANKTQSVKGGVAITNIVFTTTNATDVTLTGTLPSGVTGSFVAGVYTISGIAATETTYPATYSYTVTATPIAGFTGAPVSQSGIITVTDPNAKNILYLTTAATATDPFYTALSLKYNVTARADKLAASGPFDYSAYDLIVLHESLTGGNAATAGNELNLIKSVDKPILNLKSFFYTSGATPRWGWGTPSNGDSRAAVNVQQPTHPIFAGVSIVGDSVVLFKSYVAKNIQPTTITGIGGYVIASTSSYANVAIHEVPATIRVNATSTSKYLMVSLLSGTQFTTALTTTALTILDNAVTYLLGSTTFTPILSSDATLSSLTLSAGSLSPAFAPGTNSYEVVLPFGATAYPTITALSADANVAQSSTTFASGGTTTITVTAQDGTVNTYTIVFTVATGINEVSSASKVYANDASIIVEGQIGEEVSVVNLVGSTLYSGVISSTSEALPISLAKGVYIVLVNGVSTKVIIK